MLNVLYDCFIYDVGYCFIMMYRFIPVWTSDSCSNVDPNKYEILKARINKLISFTAHS